MISDYRSIRCAVGSEVARITLNRPPLNIMDIPMLEEMQSALAQIRADGAAKVVVINHEGKAFSAGVSIQDHTAEKVPAMMEQFHGIFRLLNSIAQPTLALVDGMALGGGCELAIFCDMVLASDRATFGQPEIKVGVFPPLAAVLFPHLIGRNKTLELLLTGEVIDANAAKAIGLINHVFRTDNFQQECEDFISKLTALSGCALKLTKRATDGALYASVNEGLASAEKLYLEELMHTHDANEGLRAYLEKRKPVWKNQ